jgi:tryptophan synthase alpha chain
MNRISRRFKELKKKDKKALIVFITAGYPSLKVTERLILEFERQGVDIVELGVPFSDPLADGPVIQESSQYALKNHVSLQQILNLVRSVRKRSNLPICLMTYYNPVYCFGEENFVKKAVQAGVDGIIIPDLPPEEGRNFSKLANRVNLSSIFFLAPTSNLKRIKYISNISRGFIYYVSLTGVTGPRHKLSSDLVFNLRRIKKNTAKPVCVGFGISNLKQIKQIYKLADGAIVGSAVVRNIKKNINSPNLVKRVARFVHRLKV